MKINENNELARLEKEQKKHCEKQMLAAEESICGMALKRG